MIIRTVISVIATLLAISAFAVELSDEQRAAIAERIKPVGEVCLQGDTSCGGPAVASSTGPRSGKAVYDASCMACHSTGAGGAPKIDDKAAWADRLAKGVDALYVSGIKGVPGTGMIAKGGCMDCTDEEIEAAVDHMVAGVQ